MDRLSKSKPKQIRKRMVDFDVVLVLCPQRRQVEGENSIFIGMFYSNNGKAYQRVGINGLRSAPRACRKDEGAPLTISGSDPQYRPLWI